MAETKGYTQTISTAEFEETPRLNLEQPTGDVYIEGWDKPEIEISISDPNSFFEVIQTGSNVIVKNTPGNRKVINFRAPDEGGLRDLESDLARAVGSLERRNIERAIERTMRHMSKVGVHLDINLGNWRGGRDYYIKVPHTCNLNLRTSSGDIKIEGVNGTLLCQTASGDLRLANVGGNVLISSSSGDIGIQSVQGKLGARSASGDIKVREASLDDLSMHTASGDLSLDLDRLPEKDFEIRAVSGDVTIYTPYDAAFRMTTRTVSGEVSCGFPRERVKYQANGRRETSLDVNGGGSLTIQLTTVSGDMSVNPRKVARTDAAGAMTTDLGRAGEGGDRTEAEGYVSRERARLEILEKLERGELSPQQALEALSQIGG